MNFTVATADAVLLINYLATFVFALGGAKVCLERPNIRGWKRVIISGIGSALCSHGGGALLRDSVLVVVSEKAGSFASSIAAVKSLDTWLIALVAFICFQVWDLRFSKRGKSFCRLVKSVFTAIDYCGLGVFVCGGIMRSVEFFHVRSFAGLVYLGTVTAIGGGLITTLLVRPNPVATLKKNSSYYVQAIVLSTIAVYAYSKGYENTNVALTLSIISGAISLFKEYAFSASSKTQRVARTNEISFPFVLITKRVEIDIRRILNPFRGIHLYIMTSFNNGRGKRCYVMTNVQA